MFFWPRALYAATIFVSALLLFLVQPAMAKVMLPWFGGSAGVWTTAMLFFQAVLLAGYWWAHRVATRLGRRAQAIVHLALLAGSLAVLPLAADNRWKAIGVSHPVLAILGLLGTSVGLPYFLLSTTTPLVQSWLAREPEARSPYRLFALSNLASLAALLAYPVVIEPYLSLGAQLRTWSAGYGLFVVLCGAAALASMRRKPLPVAYERGPASERLVWAALAACPAALWMAVANQLSQSVSPVPFLWILPLSIYLLTMILAFDREGWYSPRLFRRLFPAGVAAICIGLWQPFNMAGLAWSIPLFGGGLFICALFCHGELARRKPPTAALTSFYLMTAAGGVAGGAFVALAAPVIFTGYFELQAAVIGCVLLALALLYGVASRRVRLRLALTATAGFLIAAQLRSAVSGNVVQARNFYGSVETAERNGMRLLYNGTILHGSQYLDAARARVPTTYYGASSGAAVALAAASKTSRRVGLIGLGAGTLAAYGRTGDVFRFYEINPIVIRLATERFTYLKDSAAKIEIVPGDARLSLESEPPQGFDVLVLDAFSGDSIPVHLLTREAFDLYRRHLRAGGKIAVHLTNRYLSLAPVVDRVASCFGTRAEIVQGFDERRELVSEWALLAGDAGPPACAPNAWTDNYSNLLAALK